MNRSRQTFDCEVADAPRPAARRGPPAISDDGWRRRINLECRLVSESRGVAALPDYMELYMDVLSDRGERSHWSRSLSRAIISARCWAYSDTGKLMSVYSLTGLPDTSGDSHECA